MNPLLQVKLNFQKEKNTQKPGARNLKANNKATPEMIDQLIVSLNSILRYYRSVPKYLDGVLVDVNYNDIISKSSRIRELLKPQIGQTNDTVVGARFSDSPPAHENHIITHYIDNRIILDTIQKLRIVRDFITDRLEGGIATPKTFNKSKKSHETGPIIDYEGFGLTETQLRDLVVDCSVVKSFSIPSNSTAPNQDKFLITFYKTELQISDLMEKLKIDDIHFPYTMYGKDTIAVNRELFEILEDRVPYLISMISSDLSKVTLNDLKSQTKNPEFSIPSPGNEPTIGVIDTLFDESVYFHEWVDSIDYLDDLERSGINKDCREHGTEVTSIIVDGPALNPSLNDGCGRFRVRHFGVCGNRISVTRLIRKINEIVLHNPDIHVWNLSLGTEDEVSKNFISFDAAALDDIQAKRNVVFVISGTNDERTNHQPRLRVGSPADSLNSVVVNSVRRNGSPASYSREGTVLSFFGKPDVSYYGGDQNERIIAYSPDGPEEVFGTSFAAPWISRKLCYLIDIMGLPREVAKALLIDSAAGWEFKQSTYKVKNLLGYGIVPIDIRDLLTSDSPEIKFVVYGRSESYNTANYAIPIPKDAENKFPYIARASLCYFPECTRAQGVDYTNRELSIKFGRINLKGEIDDINENVQDKVGAFVDERHSRTEFRKWENTKFISKVLKKNRPYKAYEDRLWGLSLTSKERLSSRTKQGLNFGVVITLRELNGVNRIQDFIKACSLRGYIVNELNIKQRLDIYNKNQEEIKFE